MRAGPCSTPYAAHQGVEHDDMNVICLGGQVIGNALPWKLILTFLADRVTGEESITSDGCKKSPCWRRAGPEDGRREASRSGPTFPMRFYESTLLWLAFNVWQRDYRGCRWPSSRRLSIPVQWSGPGRLSLRDTHWGKMDQHVCDHSPTARGRCRNRMSYRRHRLRVSEQKSGMIAVRIHCAHRGRK